jgi:hypothetical protein
MAAQGPRTASFPCRDSGGAGRLMDRPAIGRPAHAGEHASSLPCWESIHRPDVPLVVEPGPAAAGPWVQELLARAPFAWRVSGAADGVASLLQEAPPALRARVASLARRFAALMDAPRVVVRVEGITDNACTRLHADFVDVRLIVTLAGPGTEHVGGNDPLAPIRQLPAGWVGLFKGHAYPGAGPGCHAPCLHRSPAIAGTAARRLLLVIDRAVEAAPVVPTGAQTEAARA